MKFLLLFLVVAFAALGQSFSEQAWKKIAPLYQEILQHPFNQELAAGTLSKDRFDFYSAQDAAYLDVFSKALATLATKLDDPKDIAHVFRFAEDCLKEKRDGKPTEMNPANFHYTQFLLATAAYQSKEELAAALLPCFWIYLRVAQDLKNKTGPNNPYGRWIKLYSGEKYEKDVAIILELTDRLAEKTTPAVRQAMLAAFVMATRMEWAFWEDAYHKAQWKP